VDEQVFDVGKVLGFDRFLELPVVGGDYLLLGVSVVVLVGHQHH
jgi:hypothetical protein